MDKGRGTTRQTFLVEHYGPDVGVDELREWACRVRETAAEMTRHGKDVHYVRSTIVPADEWLVCVLEAASEALVRETYARAGIPFERMTVAIAEEG